ncbi:response regulator [Pseudonocardiaceae bacterium YIM PH 21723]|nr:response regulator [Pseudonocardiaceae bacterium YIM PH 21723]
MIRLLIVDDQASVRSGLARILCEREGFQVVGECADGSEVPGALAAAPADVVIMDLRMRQVDGVEATRRLRRVPDAPPILALTTFDDDELLAAALRAGVAGYILKHNSAEELIRAVWAVAAGSGYLDIAVTGRVLADYRKRPAGPSGSPEELSKRERDVLRSIANGQTNAEIAQALEISEVTVKSHVGRIFSKLGLRDRSAAIVYAFDHGIVAPSGVTIGNSASIQDDASTGEAPGGLRFSVLGPLRAWSSGAPLNLGPVRQQAFLTALLLRPDVPVSKAELLSGMWGLEPPGTGADVLPRYAYLVRESLRAGQAGRDAAIVSDRCGYRFVSQGVELDTTRLARLSAEARLAQQAGDPEAAVQACDSALDLFYGEPLAGIPGPYAEGQRRRLAERRLALSQQRAELQLTLGRAVEALGDLTALMAGYPHSEPLAGLLMRAYDRCGRTADALAVFRRLRDRLADDLGIEPGDPVQRLYRRLLGGSA